MENANNTKFEIGWNQKLYDLLSEFMIENKDGNVSLEFKNKIQSTLHNKKLYHFEIDTKELSLDKNICDFISHYNTRQKEIFQTDHSIGAIGIGKNKDMYKIVLLFA